jgi:hypothetical protein
MKKAKVALLTRDEPRSIFVGVAISSSASKDGKENPLKVLNTEHDELDQFLYADRLNFDTMVVNVQRENSDGYSVREAQQTLMVWNAHNVAIPDFPLRGNHIERLLLLQRLPEAKRVYPG